MAVAMEHDVRVEVDVEDIRLAKRRGVARWVRRVVVERAVDRAHVAP